METITDDVDNGGGRTSQQQLSDDDSAYDAMENAIQTSPLDDVNHADDTNNNNDPPPVTAIKNDAGDEAMENSARNSIETAESVSNHTDDEEAQVAAAYEDMDRVIKKRSTMIANVNGGRPPEPASRISANAEQMIGALEDDDEQLVARKIARETEEASDMAQTAAAYEDMDRAIKKRSTIIANVNGGRPPEPPSRISANAEQMIGALEDDDEQMVARKIAVERAEARARDEYDGDELDNLEQQHEDPSSAEAASAPIHNSVAIRPDIRPTPRSMLPRQDTEESSSPIPVLEAELVTEPPLYMATMITDDSVIPEEGPSSSPKSQDEDVDSAVPWWRKRLFILCVAAILLFGGAMAVMGALLASNGNDDASNGNNNGGIESNELESGVVDGSPNSDDGEPLPSPSSDDGELLSTPAPMTPESPTSTSAPTNPSFSPITTQSPVASFIDPTTSDKPQSAIVSATPSSQSATTMSPTTLLYYPDWLGNRCTNDPSGRPAPEQGQRLFRTIKECCKAEFWQLKDDDACVMNSLGLTKPPTLSPSVKPTTFPTRSPSAKPTLSPSSKPTNIPSWQPTRSPSRMPTARPTDDPTTNLLLPPPPPPSPPPPPPPPPPAPSPSDSGQTPVGCHREVKVPCCQAIAEGPPTGYESAEQYCLSLSLDCDVNTIRCDGDGSSPPDGCHEQARVRCCRAKNFGPPPEFESAEQFCLSLDCDIDRRCNGSV